MGATASQCAHACCSCCLGRSTRGNGEDQKGKHRGSSASTTHDHDEEADSWLQKGKVPLLSARHDREIVEEGVVVRKVVVSRQPTPTHRSTETASPRRAAGSPTSPKRGLRVVASDNHEASPVRSPQPVHHPDDSPNSSNDDDSWELASPGRSSPNAPLEASVVSVNDDEEQEETKAEPRRTITGHRSGSAASHGSPRGEGLVGEADFDEEVKSGSPQSPRSPSKQSSGSGSPKRKTRYGRKNYRADSSRKKTL